jgi:hypothetical protein
MGSGNPFPFAGPFPSMQDTSKPFLIRQFPRFIHQDLNHFVNQPALQVKMIQQNAAIAHRIRLY